MDEATGGVPTEQRTLWTFQYFDPLDIIEREQRGGGSCHVHTVDIGRDAPFESRANDIVADAANARKRISGKVRDGQTGHRAAEIKGVRHALPGQLYIGDGGNGDRNI